MAALNAALRFLGAVLLAASMSCSVKPADVVKTYDDIVLVEIAEGNQYEYYGYTSETYVYLVMNGNGEIVAAK